VKACPFLLGTRGARIEDPFSSRGAPYPSLYGHGRGKSSLPSLDGRAWEKVTLGVDVNAVGHRNGSKASHSDLYVGN